MLKPSLKQKLKHPLTYFFLFLALLPVLWIGSALYPYIYRELPKDLGQKLEYIGHDDYGCWWPLLCDSDPSSVYYFATDMTQDEIVQYFKKAKFTGASGLSRLNSEHTYRDLFFDLSNTNGFIVSYYEDGPGVIKAKELNPSTKKHLISVGDDSYRDAKKSF